MKIKNSLNNYFFYIHYDILILFKIWKQFILLSYTTIGGYHGKYR